MFVEIHGLHLGVAHGNEYLLGSNRVVAVDVVARHGQAVLWGDGAGHGVVGDDVGHHGARGFGVAIQSGRFGQQALAQVIARRLLGDIVEDLLGFGMLALLHADRGLEIGGIEEEWGGGDNAVDLGACFGYPVLAMQRAGDAGPGPGEFVGFPGCCGRLFRHPWHRRW